MNAGAHGDPVSTGLAVSGGSFLVCVGFAPGFAGSRRGSRVRATTAAQPDTAEGPEPRSPQKMGNRDDRPAARRARTDSGHGGSEAQFPAAGPGLADALHGAPGLLAASVAASHSWEPPNPTLRLVSKACCEAVDGAVTRTRLFFDHIYQRGAQSGSAGGACSEAPSQAPSQLLWQAAAQGGAAGGASSEAVDAAAAPSQLLFQLLSQAGGPFGRAWPPKQHFACAWPRDSADQRAAAWLEPVARRLAKLPCLAEVTCSGPGGAELEQLMARAAAAHPSALAGVKRLEVHGCSGGQNESGVCGPGLPALLRSLAHLPGLQVRCWGVSGVGVAPA
jgi:hypothetical protein